ncbi:MAG TPA: hypothetical protein VM328_03875, partial [Fimbriimonadaceae bacterium]|nr:hypothetical protein [Fimbriimonadaceae bacterium]
MNTTSHAPADSAVRELLALDDDEFRRVVDRDVRAPDPARQVAALRHPAVVDRWRRCLTASKISVESQLAAKASELRAEAARAKASGSFDKKAYHEMVARYEDWRAGALRFKSGMEIRLTEARHLWTELEMVSNLKKEHSLLKERVVRLETELAVAKAAIRNHREVAFEDGVEPEPIDEKL